MESRPHLNTLAEFADFIGGVLGKDEGVHINGVTNTTSDNNNGIAFAESERYLKEAESSQIGAVIVPDHITEFPISFIRHPNPRLAFLKLLHYFEKPQTLPTGIHETAIIEPGANIHPTAKIGAMAFISETATVGENSQVFPFVYIGARCTVGKNCQILPHAVLLQDVSLGDHCEVGPGAVLGHSGFGYVWDGTQQVKIPQVGGVLIDDNVDIGALTAIDRATADQTIIGEGNKIDNLVQIAHNAQVGPHGVFASQVGIAGSSKIGARAAAGGQSGYADHLEIAEGVTIAGRTAVLGSIAKPGFYGGTPAVPFSEYRRIVAVQNDLPGLLKRVRALEKQVNALSKEGNE